MESAHHRARRNGRGGAADKKLFRNRAQDRTVLHRRNRRDQARLRGGRPPTTTRHFQIGTVDTYSTYHRGTHTHIYFLSVSRLDCKRIILFSTFSCMCSFHVRRHPSSKGGTTSSRGRRVSKVIPLRLPTPPGLNSSQQEVQLKARPEEDLVQ